MADQRITIRERVRAVDWFEYLAFQANEGAAWLSSRDFESEADLAQEGAVRLLAAVALLSRPLRREVPPDRWKA